MAVHAPITGAPLRATPTPFQLAHAAYVEAERKFTALPSSLELSDPDAYKREEDGYLATYHAYLQAPIADWRELVTVLAGELTGPGHPAEDTAAKLVADAKRLLDAPATMGAVDLYALDHIMQRIDHVAATAHLLADVLNETNALVADAMHGIAATLTEQAKAMDERLQPHRRAVE